MSKHTINEIKSVAEWFEANKDSDHFLIINAEFGIIDDAISMLRGYADMKRRVIPVNMEGW